MKPVFIACLSIAVGLALGVFVRDVAQDWRDKQRAEKLAEQVRACPQFVVVTISGKLECRPLMPRLDFVWPTLGKRRM